MCERCLQLTLPSICCVSHAVAPSRHVRWLLLFCTHSATRLSWRRRSIDVSSANDMDRDCRNWCIFRNCCVSFGSCVSMAGLWMARPDTLSPDKMDACWWLWATLAPRLSSNVVSAPSKPIMSIWPVQRLSSGMMSSSGWLDWKCMSFGWWLPSLFTLFGTIWLKLGWHGCISELHVSLFVLMVAPFDISIEIRW